MKELQCDFVIRKFQSCMQYVDVGKVDVLEGVRLGGVRGCEKWTMIPSPEFVSVRDGDRKRGGDLEPDPAEQWEPGMYFTTVSDISVMPKSAVRTPANW